MIVNGDFFFFFCDRDKKLIVVEKKINKKFVNI